MRHDLKREKQKHHQAGREWAGVAVTVTTERIVEPVEWLDEHAEHLLIVNLGGVTSRLEAKLGQMGNYVGAPTVGELSVIPAGERFGGVYQGTAVRFAHVLFKPSGLLEAQGCEMCERDIPLRASLGVTDPFLFGCVLELASLVEADDAQSDLFGESIALVLKQHMVRRHGFDGHVRAKPSGLPAAEVAKVQAFITEHIGEPLTLAKLADAVGAPVHHLVTGFRTALGTSPARYVLAQRIRRARWLLAHSSTTLAEIAYACGLSSQSHLTTAFRKETGITPAAFRAQFQGGGFGAVQ